MTDPTAARPLDGPLALDGTVALVTGASSGIGEATALALARAGATVAVAARRTDRLADLVGRITDTGGHAAAVELDVTDTDAAKAAVDQVAADHGRLDIVINNAGVMLLGPAADAPFEEWQRMVDLNVTGLLAVAHAAVPHLLKAADGGPRQVADMVNISSVAGRIARSGSGVYNATKFAVGAFSESLRQEFAGRHLRISLVEPGAVDTELTDHLRDEVREQTSRRFEGVEKLLGDDIADAITYIVTRPRRVAVNEVLIRPTAQEG